MPLIDRVGLWTGGFDATPVADIPAIVAALDSQGWSSLWFAEAWGRDAMTTAQLLLSTSERLVVGSSIANIYARDAVTTAAAARTLHALHNGRFVLGLGVSHAPLVERLRGHTYGRPVAAMTDYLAALTSVPTMIPGEAELPPVMIAALGPRMLGLAREHTAGALPYLTLPSHTAQARQALGTDRRLVVEQAAVVTGDENEWQRRTHAHLEIYTGLPNYRGSFTRQGFTDEDMVRGGSDRLKRALVTHGVDATLGRVQEHLDAGADEVVVQVLGENVLAAPVADWQVLAGELR